MTPDSDVAGPLWKLSETLPSLSGSGDRLIDRVCEQMESRNWEASEVFAMRLALSEALQNAVEHGNKRVVEKKVRLYVELNDSKALACVSDEGKGFNFGDIPDPTLEENICKECGRGLYLIRNLMTNVWHNKSGNVIYMEKKHNAPETKQ